MVSKSAVSVRELLRVHPDGREILAGVHPGATPGVKGRKQAELERDATIAQMADLQERLFAERTRAVLLVLQGMDTSGKDGTVEHVIGGLNPSGSRISSFKQPTPEELRHDFLWRIKRALPHPGEIGIFNRSHYEDVIVVRVKRLAPEKEWRPRFDKIDRFERRLVRDGIVPVKVFLHISYDEQRRRLLRRLHRPDKRWKFNEDDIEERGRWSQYQGAWDEAIARCSIEEAPWFVVPADRKWYRNWAVARILVETLEQLDPQYPQPDLDVDALAARLAPPG